MCTLPTRQLEVCGLSPLLSFTFDQQSYPEPKKGFLNKFCLNSTFLWKDSVSANRYFLTKNNIKKLVCWRGFLTALLGQGNQMPLFRLYAIRSFHLIYQLTLQWVPSRLPYKFPFGIPKSRI